MVMFTFFINDGLEQAWGSFRLNLCVIGGALLVALGALFLGAAPTGLFLWLGFLMAFAILYPEHEIMLFFVIPVKMKWLGIMDALICLFFFGVSVAALSHALPLTIILSLFIPGIFVGPDWVRGIHRQLDAADRRRKFESKAKGDPEDAFHTCDGCGITDVEEPELEFRVTEAGEELCSRCRPDEEKPENES